MSNRYIDPVDQYDWLRRLHICNWTELAKRLGVTPATLKRWRSGEHGANCVKRCQDLMMETLRGADDCVWLLLPVSWENVATIGGRR